MAGKKCPSCGACQECGHTPQLAPYPYPVYPVYPQTSPPWWYRQTHPYTVTYDSNTAARPFSTSYTVNSAVGVYQ